MVILKTKPFIGASPDGIVNCECCGSGLLEIKCPISVAHTSPGDSNLQYLKKNKDSEIHLNNNHSYYTQVQHQMGVLNCSWCDFFIYSRHGYYIERIIFDPSYWIKLETAAEQFFRCFIGPKLIGMVKDEDEQSREKFNAVCIVCHCFFLVDEENNLNYTCHDCKGIN